MDQIAAQAAKPISQVVAEAGQSNGSNTGAPATYETRNSVQGITTGNQWTNAAYAAPSLITAANTGASAISSENLAYTPRISLPTLPDFSDTYKTAMTANAGAVKNIMSSLGLENIDVGQVDPGSAALLAFGKNMADAQKADAEKFVADRKAERVATGIDEQNRKILELNLQIGQLNEKAGLGKVAIGNEKESTVVLGREQRLLLEQNAIKTGALAAEVQARTGYVELARQTLNDTYQLEKTAYDARAENRKTLLGIVEKIGDVQQQKTARLEAAQIAKDQAEYNKFLEAKYTALGNATSNPKLMSAISAAKDFKSLSVIPGVQINKPELMSVGSDSVVIDKNTGRVVYGGGGGGGGGSSIMAGLTPEQQADPFIAKMVASAGGKPLTDTFAQSLNKGLNVLGQIGVLQANIKDVKTGPIVGAFKGMNPWDTNAQTIKAQLNAIVPNLARGVYGEVGVLTDNDIAQYSKTLPNLKSTEDIRNAVLGITVDMIGKSIKRTLEVNAANGKDVSKFIDLYTEMQNTRNSIFSQIPGYGQKQQFVITGGNGKSINLSAFEGK
jgi:hypothetical protein